MAAVAPVRVILEHVLAGATTPAFDRTFRLGGSQVRQVCTDASLVPMMTTAFRHLDSSIGPRPVDLTVVCMTATPADIAALAGQRNWTHSQVRADSVQLLDVPGRLGVHAVTDMASARDFEVGTPMRQLLHWWVVQSGSLLVHAARVAGFGQVNARPPTG